jgi:Ca-activated chloride channel family protein
VLEGWGRDELARLLFERALESSPRETQNWRELLLLEAKEGNEPAVRAMGNRFKAATKDGRMHDVESQVDSELKRWDGNGHDLRLDPKADVQVELMFDTNYSYVDLHIIEPDGEEVTWNRAESKHGGLMSGQWTMGYGPEIYTIHHAPRGPYQIDVQYYSDDWTAASAAALVHVLVYVRGERHDYLVALAKPNERRTVATVTP